ncbi:MAG: hypothetical protein CSA20_09280 [Deltaproteobacteria bacterium]|nr:MAG: hypothetical protein CSA20_09280 [Deltaproteobacteria bacterium]
MKHISLALFFVALSALTIELSLVRTFDVIWHPNMAYMIITMVMFCFGLAGVFLSLKTKLLKDAAPHSLLTTLSILYGISSILILPLINVLPINFHGFYYQPFKTIALFCILYFVISLPFFLAGLIITVIFNAYSASIQKLYFWDLLGAGLGCLLIAPLTPFVGPGGITIISGGIGFVAAGLFSTNKKVSAALLITGLLVIAIPCGKSYLTEGYINKYFDFRHHITKRGVMSDINHGKLEASYWDPISKVEIINQDRWKHVAYDGGNQSSFIFPFDGDYQKLRASLPASSPSHFGIQAVYLADSLKEGSHPEVLIIGSAAGQETKAALTFGASHIDAVEMVGFVVKAGTELYKDYNGGIFNDPRVTAHVGEGRSFLRATDKKYDIIQIFSNHTSSSIAAGSGAMATTYLQTSDAYKEYFSHLKEDGLLQINHHIYPRMVTTAARAWKEMGRGNFRKHVLVFGAPNVQDNLPTFLVRMTPWTEKEVEELRTWFWGSVKLLEAPYRPEDSMLTDEFYSGKLSQETLDFVPYRVSAATDNLPYFNYLRKEWKFYKRAYPEKYMDYGTAALLSSQYIYRGTDGKYHERMLPTDLAHLFITGAGAFLFAMVFILIPLLFARVGREKWPHKPQTMGYFACLGAGFIIIELVFIQIFMKLIGFPLYTYSCVVCSLLIAAGLGSYSADALRIRPDSRWTIPFVGTVVSVGLLLLSYPFLFNQLLPFNLATRIFSAALIIFPAGFFMGMCFPLGILAVRKRPSGAIAWAWGMNGLFTVIGGISSVLISIHWGFNKTLLVGLAIYMLAFFLFHTFKEKV